MSAPIRILLSFLGTLAVPCLVVLIIGICFRFFGKKKAWPAVGFFVKTSLFAAAQTVGITFGICLIFYGTGFFENAFFRPSKRDYGELEKLQVAAEAVTFDSLDGTKLQGYFLSGGEQPWGTVVHFHGSDRNSTYTIRHVGWLASEGLNVFAFDYRGYGQSEGQPSHAKVVEDGVAALRYVGDRSDVDRDKLFVWGQSMGGQLGIVAAAADDVPVVRAVVSEATYSLHSLHIADKLSQMGPLWLIQWGAWALTGDAHAALHHVGQLHDQT
ncbi:MAG: alpha/beta hydrolase, partial [Phycisphaerae bacterium]